MKIYIARLYLLLILLFIFLSIGCGGGGGGSNNSKLSSSCSLIGLKIINGESCGNEDRSPIVRVAIIKEINGLAFYTPICTGTLISSDDVLTAAHCKETSTSSFPVLGYGIITGKTGQTSFYLAKSFNIHPNYTINSQVNRLFNDVGIISLNKSPGLAPLPILTSSAPVEGETGFIYGYGSKVIGDISEDDTLFQTLQGGTMTLGTITENHIFTSFAKGGSNVCNGDSGGPLIVERNSSPAIVGVTSQGSITGCDVGDVTTFTNINSSNILNWILQEVPDASLL